MSGINTQRASDVRVQEINLSQVITGQSTSVAAQVIVAKQGITSRPAFFTNADNYKGEFGNPDSSVSYDVYTGLDYFEEGDQLWAIRAVHEDALYAGLGLYQDGAATGLYPMTGGIKDPEFPPFSQAVPAPSDESLAIFYPTKGQGSYAHSIAVSIVTSNVNTPSGIAVTSTDTGGQLLPGTYSYQIAARNAAGETLASNIVTVTIAGTSVNNCAIPAWLPEPLATAYEVYGRTGGAMGLIAQVGQGTYSFVDTGAITPDILVKPITDPAEAAPYNPLFTVNVYNTLNSIDQPAETFSCTLGPGLDYNSNTTELEEAINPYSDYINVASNAATLLALPKITSVPMTYLAGGDSGSAPTVYDIAAAYAVFKNKQVYRINTLINGGHANPVVQLAMDKLSQGRGDTIAMLDTPSNQQKMQQAINYRNLTLNLNSTYSALFCPDVLEADTINGKQVYVPFSGWAAALCARTDRVANPSFSIAGLNRGLVPVLKTRYTYDDGEATELYKAQVNYTRTFVGQGIALWEQRTLAAQASALSWISVRRIVNVIKTSLVEFLMYTLQEPNDDFSGRQIVSACTDYLQLIQNARGISSFTVVSDRSNNSAAMLNAGIRAVTVIIVPVIPIHEIQLAVVISKQGIDFTETLRQINGQA